MQKEHITEKLVKRLQLKSSNSQNVILNKFENSKGKSAILKYYSFCVKNPKTGCNLYLTGFAVPVICVPLTAYKIVVEALIPTFKDLDVSDTRMHDSEIDLLIGSDYYWSVVEDENRRYSTAGLAAVNSKVGWLLSGPLNHGKDEDSAAVKLAMHTMIVGFNENYNASGSLSTQRY